MPLIFLPETDLTLSFGDEMKHLLRKSFTGFCVLVVMLVTSIACHPTHSTDISIPEGGVWSNSWIDTGIQIRKGQTVIISATGSVRPSTASDVSAGPDGTSEVQGWQDSYCFNSEFPHEAIIARIGSGEILLIGSGEQFTAQTAGTLELGVNDTDPINNEGSFEVEINW